MEDFVVPNASAGQTSDPVKELEAIFEVIGHEASLSNIGASLERHEFQMQVGGWTEPLIYKHTDGDEVRISRRDDGDIVMEQFHLGTSDPFFSSNLKAYQNRFRRNPLLNEGNWRNPYVSPYAIAGPVRPLNLNPPPRWYKERNY
ncbi:MAG: hypothetical protein SFW62_02850 [Alphaproteobacteria bacterium]|nr:hypothetical protein [Alphaproteobacteria bacterium]